MCGFEDEDKGESENVPEVPPQFITHLEPVKPPQVEPNQILKQVEEAKSNFQLPAMMDQQSTNLAASKSSGSDHATFDVPSVSKKRKASETTAVDDSNMMHMAKYRKTNEQTVLPSNRDLM